MTIPIILFLLGFLCLIKGGDWFVDGAVGLAQRFQVPDLLIGATVVSIGTTLPEVMVSTTSALTGHGEIAYGNAIGSVICNTALIAAITIAVRPGKTDRKALGLPLLFFFGAAAVYAVTAYTTGYFSRSIGLLLLAMFVVYIIISVIQAKQASQSGHSQQSGELIPVPKTLILLVVGAALIAVGAKLLVDNGTLLAQAAGVPEAVIGLTLVALGTSLPELITAVTSLVKGHSSLSLGKYVLSFFSLFSIDSLYHCVIAKKIKNVAQHIEYDCEDTFSSFIDSPKYKIYDALRTHHEDLTHFSIERDYQQRKERARQLVQHYDLVQFQNLLQVCTECLASIDQNEHELAFGMRLVMEVLAENHELFPDVVKIYIKENTPYSVRPDEILRSLFTMMPPLDVKELITSYDFAEKDAWLWAFYSELPENAISIAWAEDFLLYLQFPSKSLHTAPYRPLYQLKKYECADKDIILKSSRIISEHYEDSPFIFSLYFFDTINPYGTDNAEVIKQYKDDISLLEDVYLKYIMH